MLDAKHGEPFAGLYADLRGDALPPPGRPAEARAAYQAALAKFDAKSPYRNYVQVKLDALPGGPRPRRAGSRMRLRPRRGRGTPRRDRLRRAAPRRSEGSRKVDASNAAASAARVALAARALLAGCSTTVVVGCPTSWSLPAPLARLAHGTQRSLEARAVARAHGHRRRRAWPGR